MMTVGPEPIGTGEDNKMGPHQWLVGFAVRQNPGNTVLTGSVIWWSDFEEVCWDATYAAANDIRRHLQNKSNEFFQVDLEIQVISFTPFTIREEAGPG